MGRRSINTTKSGKYMNPTDQARKEARKKELKKNKKQRQLVRAAVLKNKDPSQILEEMEKIDEMEYNVMQPSPLNEKVLKDKRKKLRETFDRVMRLYHNDDPEQWAELKRKEVEYEKRRLKKQQYYESVKHAQSVQIDEIPLPSSNQTCSENTLISSNNVKQLPLRLTTCVHSPCTSGIFSEELNKITNDINGSEGDKIDDSKRNEQISLPIGPPPDLLEMSDLDTDAENDEVILKKYVPKMKTSKVINKQTNTFQQRILAISGQNIDEFMKEMENVYKKKEQEAAASLQESSILAPPSQQLPHDPKNIQSKLEDPSEKDMEIKSENLLETIRYQTNDTTIQTPLVSGVNTILPSILLPSLGHGATSTNLAPMSKSLSSNSASEPLGMVQPMFFRPPFPRPPGVHAFPMRMPTPPAPPSTNPRHLPIGGIHRLGIRIPGPPPGMPPRLIHQHKQQQHQLSSSNNKDSKAVATITAKPQIRNLSADVTRFVPSTLRMKRDDNRKLIRSKPYSREIRTHTNVEINAKRLTSKDDAYLQFMNEMQGLL